jgi:hypothetical protein
VAVAPRYPRRRDVRVLGGTAFSGIRWLGPDAVLDIPIELLDPELHRTTRKLLTLL